MSGMTVLKYFKFNQTSKIHLIEDFKSVQKYIKWS